MTGPFTPSSLDHVASAGQRIEYVEREPGVELV
jgi:hypothetical protein